MFPVIRIYNLGGYHRPFVGRDHRTGWIWRACWLSAGGRRQWSDSHTHIAGKPGGNYLTDLQVICLFRSSPVNTLHGSLSEVNERLHGLLDRVRNPELFRRELGRPPHRTAR